MKGYNLFIRNYLITNSKGKIIKLGLLDNKESPDKISLLNKRSWFSEWRGHYIEHARDFKLHLIKDGGEIPYYTGATTTARAITNATNAIILESLYNFINNTNIRAEEFSSCNLQ